MEHEFAIGVDVGGTNTVVGVVSRSGKVVAQSSIKTCDYERAEDFADALASTIESLIEGRMPGCKIAGIGIGAPDGNYFTGSIEYATNLRWEGIIPLASIISDRLGGMRVTLTNDANAAAMGEMMYGAARGMNDFIMLTLGTGVGGGIVANGRLVYGRHGAAGELGLITVVPDGRECNCPNKGCLEAYASATGVAYTARELLDESQMPSALRELAPERITAKDVAEAAMRGDRLASEVFEFTGRIMGRALAGFAAFSDPEAIILFGGLTKAGSLLTDPVRRHMEANLLPSLKGRVKLLVSALNEGDAAILGASALAWEQ